jgi:ABC-2 type transport system ATP-binding protein
MTVVKAGLPTGGSPDALTAGPRPAREVAPADRRTPTRADRPEPWAIAVRGLRKAFGSTTVLDSIDLHVARGTIFALLGPNGAGKTTTVQILSTLVAPDGGEVRIVGFDPVREPQAVRAAIGVTGQFSAVDNFLSGQENLLLMADLHHLDRREGRRRADELLERFDLVDAAGRRVATYSGGMRRRLDLAMTLVGDPQIIFLDEPTTGLDPRSRLTMWEIVEGLAVAGVTILLTTQTLEEADRLAHRVAILDRGRVVAEGTPAELKRRIPGGRVTMQLRDRDTFAAAAPLFNSAIRDDDSFALQVPTDGTAKAVMAVLGRLQDHGLGVERFTVQAPDLDDVFLALTGTDHRAQGDSK